MATLNDTQMKTALSWLNDFFILAKFRSIDKDKRPEDYAFMHKSAGAISLESAAISILNEIKKQNHADLDDAFNLLAKEKFELSTTDRTVVQATPKTLAGFVAAFCVKNKIIWNDGEWFPEEREYFCNTYLGGAIRAFGGLFSQYGEAPEESWEYIVRESKPTPVRHRSGSGALPKGEVAKDDYKSSGPRSQDARGLIGEPHVKVSGVTTMYAVHGYSDKAHKDPQFAFIRPFSNRAVTSDGKNKVLFGSNNAYRDCIIWFDNEDAAIKTLRFLEDKGRIKPDRIYDLGVIPHKKVANGYFKFETETGIECYVVASKFNEAIEAAKEGTEELVEEVIEEEVLTDEYHARRLPEGGYEIDARFFEDGNMN